MHNIKHSGASVAHYRIIRRMDAQVMMPAVGTPTPRTSPSAVAQPAGALLSVILAPRAMVQAFCRGSAPPGRTQVPPRPLVPPRWCSVPVVGVEGGAA